MRLLIVEDVRETRDWLCRLAREAFGEIEIADAATMRPAIALCRERRFDLALVDLGLPEGDGLGVIRHLRAHHPETPCIVITLMAGDADIVAALSAGAEGYLLKGEPDAVLVRQLRQLSEGIPALSPPIARRIMAHFRLTGPVAEPDGTLTERERDVLSKIARGYRVVDAAVDLGLAESTVASHIKSIYRKLGISSRAEATLHATRMGLLREER